ncbi:nucleoside-diphosphate sugar epimerase/dehydratase [Aeromicrobium sp. UC242_57]|uniref:nucleoside-diphosphate sugar epimerase/dehydratase n=1 Tax=Aeromicrobium sp. UC242_57 TaxID=3374624 RepID=UPI00378810DA
MSLIAHRSRDQRLFGDDAEEYRRVVRATVFTFSLLAIVSLLVKADFSRGYLALAFPLGMVGLLISRKVWRTWLRKQRYRGIGLARVLMIGGEKSSTRVAQTFDANKTAGFRVTGVWEPDRQHAKPEWLDVSDRFVPVLGTERTLAEALTISNANTVIITDTEHLGHDGLRELMWQLESAGIDLMVSPNMVDVAGARLHMRGISGMSFLHLEEPQYASAGSWPKALFDRFGATFISSRGFTSDARSRSCGQVD